MDLGTFLISVAIVFILIILAILFVFAIIVEAKKYNQMYNPKIKKDKDQQKNTSSEK